MINRANTVSIVGPGRFPGICFQPDGGDGGTGNTGDGGTGDKGDSKGDGAVTFTAEQEAHIGNLFKTWQDANKPTPAPANNADLEKVLKAAGAKNVDDLLKKLTAKPDDKNPGVSNEDVTRQINEMKTDYETKLTGAETKFTNLVNRLVDAEIAKAAGELQFFNGDDAALRLKGQVRFNAETGEMEVLDANGNVRFDVTAGKKMAVKTLVAELAKTHDYLVQGGNRSGGGSGNSHQNSGDAGKRMYKRSELRDPATYAANADDIRKAVNEGRIIED